MGAVDRGARARSPTWATVRTLFEAHRRADGLRLHVRQSRTTSRRRRLRGRARPRARRRPGRRSLRVHDERARRRRAVAAGLRERFALPFAAEDVYLTNGNFAGLVDRCCGRRGPGDEVVFVSPPWFFYETLIVGAGATPVRVSRIARRSISTWRRSRRRSHRGPAPIIVNSPNNPTGTDLPARHARRARQHPDRSARSATAGRSTCCPTRPTTGSCSTVARSDAGRLVPAFVPLYTYAKTHLAPGLAVGLRRGAAHDARAARSCADRCCSPRSRAAGRSRWRCCSTRSRDLDAIDGRHRPPPATARPPGPGAPRAGLRRWSSRRGRST